MSQTENPFFDDTLEILSLEQIAESLNLQEKQPSFTRHYSKLVDQPVLSPVTYSADPTKDEILQ